jgi:hypothetical protein
MVLLLIPSNWATEGNASKEAFGRSSMLRNCLGSFASSRPAGAAVVSAFSGIASLHLLFGDTKRKAEI